MRTTNRAVSSTGVGPTLPGCSDEILFLCSLTSSLAIFMLCN